MDRDKDKYAISSITKPELENDQWFPEVPAKPVTKWSFIIALWDEIAILVILILFIYVLANRF